MIGRISNESIDLSIGLYIQNVSTSKVGWSGVLLQEKANGKRYFLKYKDGTSSKDYGHRSPITENLECFTRYRCFWSRICSGNQVEVTATEGSQDCAPPTTAGGLCPGTMWSPNGSEPTSVTCIETPDDPTPPTPPTDPTNPPTPPPGGTNPDPFVNVELPSAAPAAEADVLNIPCSASYNFIRQGNWQSAVIVDYKFGLYNRAGNGQYYYINVGPIEVGLPYITFDGSIIQANIAQGMSTLAATDAEQATAGVLSAIVIANPEITPSMVINSASLQAKLRQHFKNAYIEALNDLLRNDWDYAPTANPARVNLDPSSFSLKDGTQYKTLKFRGRDC